MKKATIPLCFSSSSIYNLLKKSVEYFNW